MASKRGRRLGTAALLVEHAPRPPQRRSRSLRLPRSIRSRSSHTRCRARSPRRLTRTRCRNETPRALSLASATAASQRPERALQQQSGAKTIVTALLDKTLPQADLDGPTVERLATVLGDDPAIKNSSSSSAASSARSCCSTAGHRVGRFEDHARRPLHRRGLGAARARHRQ
jgi:hypothetical protein